MSSKGDERALRSVVRAAGERMKRIAAVSPHLVCKVLQREAPPHEHPRLAVLGEHLVVVAQGHRRADVRALLAPVGHVERYSALPLRVKEDAVHRLEAHHGRVHPQARVAVHVRRLGVRSDASILVHDSVDGHRLVPSRRMRVHVGHIANLLVARVDACIVSGPHKRARTAETPASPNTATVDS